MMQHLNNAAYLDYVMDAGVQLTSAFGWPMSYWLKEGIAFVTRRNSIEYLSPAYLDDILEIRTWLFNVRPATVTRFIPRMAVIAFTVPPGWELLLSTMQVPG